MNALNRSVALSTFEDAARRYVLGIVMPLWIAAAAGDYVLHRRSSIEATSGTVESSLHASGIALAAIPVLSGLLCELDAGVVLAMTGAYVAHVGMTIWDVAYANARREIVPAEQHVHALLELLPFTALSLVLCSAPGQTLALLGRGSERPRFKPRPKIVPLDGRAIAGLITAFGAFVAIPYAEELARCIRYDRRSVNSLERPATETTRAL